MRHLRCMQRYSCELRLRLHQTIKCLLVKQNQIKNASLLLGRKNSTSSASRCRFRWNNTNVALLLVDVWESSFNENVNEENDYLVKDSDIDVRNHLTAQQKQPEFQQKLRSLFLLAESPLSSTMLKLFDNVISISCFCSSRRKWNRSYNRHKLAASCQA